MKKLLIAVLVLAGLAALVRRATAGWRRIDWDQAFAGMPDNAPPKWMFNNISSIRENTEHIIELLEGAPPEREVAPVTVGGSPT
jgi:hypothetical protein